MRHHTLALEFNSLSKQLFFAETYLEIQWIVRPHWRIHCVFAWSAWR